MACSPLLHGVILAARQPRRQEQCASEGLSGAASESGLWWGFTLALEIERRFLVSGSQWRCHSLWQARLRQGYLGPAVDALTVRVRTSEPLEPGTTPAAWLTIKATAEALAAGAVATEAAVAPQPLDPQPALHPPQRTGAALRRLEFEYEIPLEDAQALLALTSLQVVKQRHGLDLQGGDWVLDVFEGCNAPLVVAEVELEHPSQAVEIPDWCVMELTDWRQLSNAALAARPLAVWSEAERQALLGDGG